MFELQFYYMYKYWYQITFFSQLNVWLKPLLTNLTKLELIDKTALTRIRMDV